MDSAVTELFLSSNESCIDYEECYLPFFPCLKNETHPGHRYSDASAAWVLISAIIVFFMKAGFLLVELAFAQNVREKRHVVVLKHLDVFASAFGFFFIGFTLSDYSSTVPQKFLKINDPLLWFFKFTFASNAATIVGGCLVTNQYKFRLLSAFLSSFIITGVIHSLIARWVWSDEDVGYFSVYRFCNTTGCEEDASFSDRMYVLDFAGGGAVHIVGGTAGFVLCLFAKLQNYLVTRKALRSRSNPDSSTIQSGEATDTLLRDQQETVSRRDFWEWMYPVDGGGETTNEAALGVLILWFCWFAFNCGSTENLETFHKSTDKTSYSAVPSTIAVNMIMAASAGGVAALLIASWAQIRSNSESVNANEIANGILSALVAITAGCPFYDYWAACIIGVIAVIVYHFGCWLEYKFHLEDTARVVPLHGLCGLWSLLAVGFFIFGKDANCNLHITFEGLCYCHLRLPRLSYGERLASQFIGALLMFTTTGVIITVVYGILFMIPIKTRVPSGGRFSDKYNRIMSRVLKVMFRRDDILFDGNLLFTGPSEIPHANYRLPPNICRPNRNRGREQRLGRDAYADISSQERPSSQDYGSLDPVQVQIRETLGSVEHHEGETDDYIITPAISNSMFDTNDTSGMVGTSSCSITGTNNGSMRPIN